MHKCNVNASHNYIIGMIICFSSPNFNPMAEFDIASNSILLLFCCTSLLLNTSSGCDPVDLSALLEFKSDIVADRDGLVAGWSSASDCCSWHGITCDPSTGRVTEISLGPPAGDAVPPRPPPQLEMAGTISPSVGSLTSLRVLDLGQLKGFSGAIPPSLGGLSQLVELDLGCNALSGQIPPALGSLARLEKLNLVLNNLSGPIPPLNRLEALKSLFLSSNRFSGEIPAGFFDTLRHLKKLHLENNDFSGPIPPSAASIKTLIELQLEGNRFSGEIPAGLGARFGAKSFEGNEGLCGPPLANRPCGIAAGDAAEIAAAIAASNPHSALSSGANGSVALMVAMVILFALVIVGIASVKRRQEGEVDTLGVANGQMEAGEAKKDASVADAAAVAGGGTTNGSTQRSASSLKGGAAKGERKSAPGDLVMVNEEKGVFGLLDLMKAAAEVLGNGGMGSAYKAVMVNGMAVAVKRVKDMNRVGKETFDLELRRLGRLRHKNVLPPLAYHYRKEEKLIIYEYIPNGSLLYVLHGNKAPEQTSLDWPTRMKIILGIVRGMVYLHGELTSVDIPHGNLKSGNVLLAADFEPLLIDYGYVPLVNPSQASQTMFAYKSPESVTHRHVCPKSDVYCLGIVILEVLTGKFPSQYLDSTRGGTDVVEWTSSAIKGNHVGELVDPAIVTDSSRPALPEMERLIKVGAACVEADLEKRITMKAALEQIEEIVEDVAKKAAS